jgi:2-(1,2-epoxy-1,2-dihydrophenyl)acetyl-CoA isomerase
MEDKAGDGDVLVTQSDPAPGVRLMLLCDPLGRNAVNGPMRAALSSGLEAALRDETVRAIVIGSGARNFSTGGDIASIAALSSGVPGLELMEAVGRLATALACSRKPLVAAVQGHCVGAGAGIALLCDTIIADDSAAFTFPFLKLGLVPDFGVSRTLAQRIGLAAARQVILYARTIRAPQALELGLVDELVPAGELRTRAVQLAATLAAMPPHALWLTRQMLRAEAMSVERGLREEGVVQASRFGSPEVAEGLAAFREKRPANFLKHSMPPGDGA